MKVFGFMVPAKNVVTCYVGSPLKAALDNMVEKKIGAIVVLDNHVDTKPVGLLTKSDFLEAYQRGLSLDKTPVEDIMSKQLFCLSKDMHKDEAAKFFGRNKVHHGIVVNDDGDFMGLISSYDLATDSANQDRAWPWIRSEDGKFHHPFAKSSTVTAPDSPTSVRRDSHAFLDYIDSVRGANFMDD